MTELTTEEKREARNRAYRLAALIALPLALVALVPSVFGLVLLQREVSIRTDENKRLITEVQRHETEQAKLRAQNREAVRKADVLLCQDLEDIKSELRGIVRFDPEGTRFTLEQLGIDPDSTRGQLLIQRSKRQAAEASERLKARTGGCKTLPRPKVPEEEIAP